MIFKTDIHPWIQYLIVILVVCFSGDQPFSAGWGDELLIALFIFLGVLYLTRKKSPLALSDLSVIFLFLMILAVQAISFNFFPLVTIAGFIIRLLVGFAAVRLVDNFPRIYINVIYVICIVSLCFYIPEQLFHAVGRDFASLFTPIVHLVEEVFLVHSGDADILIYNFEFPAEVHRNAGIFWEPGAFAGYILLALIFLGLNKDSYEKRFYMARFYMMLITLLTTLSTMGYLVCSVVLMIHYRLVGRRTVAANLGWLFIIIMVSPLLVYGAIRVWNFDFMEQKIKHQYELAASPRMERLKMTRISSLLLDWEYIKRRPFFGWGINPKTYYALDPRDEFITKGRGNGLTGFVHAFGLLGFGGFVAAAWKGLYILSGNNFFLSFLAVAAILLMLNGEPYLNYPLFQGLMFLRKSRWKSAEENGMNTRDYHERAASIGLTVA